MVKINVGFKFGAIVIVLFALLFLGVWYKKQAEQAAVVAPEEFPSTEPIVKKIFEPLKLVYELSNFGPTGSSGKMNMTIYLEGEQQCAGRDAYVGIVKIDNVGSDNSSTQWSKITIFSDNGEVAVSRFENEDKLAFDDMKSEYDQLNISLTLNSIFAYAGKNFNSPDVWSSTSPILLKNVDSGMSLTDYSVIRQEEQLTGVLPCRKFKIVAKGTSVNGTYNACVAEEVGEIKLPFVVSFAFGDSGQNSPSWQLTSYSKEKSGIVFVPQCMEPVNCAYVIEPVQVERNACSVKGGQIEQQRTEQGCISEYKCLTQEDIASESISKMQQPGCAVNQTVLNKLVGCRKNNQPNFSITSYSEDGCAMGVTCRQ